MVCLVTLIPIKKIVATHHNVIFVDRQKFTKSNINFLIEGWMFCDLLWALKFPRSKHAMRLKGNEEYCFEEIMSKFFLMIIVNIGCL
jgi:hypothetical protein